MKRLLLLLISFLIGAILFVFIIKVVGWQEIKNAFSVFTVWHGLAILGLTILIVLISNWRWKEILKGCGVEVSFLGLLNLYLASFSIRYLAPIAIVGSEIFQAYSLKTKNQISWSKGMASVIIDRILEWTANLTVIFLGASFFLYKIGIPSKKLLIIFGGAFLIFLFAILFFYFKTFKRESITKALGKIFNSQLDSKPLETETEIFNFFRLEEISMWKSFILSYLRVLIMHFRTWLLIVFLGKNMGWWLAFSILGFTYLAAVIPIPTSLGLHEAIQTFSFNSLGLGLPVATAFTMIIRGVELIAALIGVIILFRFGASLLKKQFV